MDRQVCSSHMHIPFLNFLYMSVYWALALLTQLTHTMTRQKSTRWLGVPGRGSQFGFTDYLWADTSRNIAGQETHAIGETNFNIPSVKDTLCLCNPEMCPYLIPCSIFCFQIYDGGFYLFSSDRTWIFTWNLVSQKVACTFSFKPTFFFIYMVEFPFQETLKPLVYDH